MYKFFRYHFSGARAYIIIEYPILQYYPAEILFAIFQKFRSFYEPNAYKSSIYIYIYTLSKFTTILRWARSRLFLFIQINKEWTIIRFIVRDRDLRENVEQYFSIRMNRLSWKHELEATARSKIMAEFRLGIDYGNNDQLLVKNKKKLKNCKIESLNRDFVFFFSSLYNFAWPMRNTYDYYCFFFFVEKNLADKQLAHLNPLASAVSCSSAAKLRAAFFAENDVASRVKEFGVHMSKKV